jgi:hypothetical protein
MIKPSNNFAISEELFVMPFVTQSVGMPKLCLSQKRGVISHA